MVEFYDFDFDLYYIVVGDGGDIGELFFFVDGYCGGFVVLCVV